MSHEQNVAEFRAGYVLIRLSRRRVDIHEVRERLLSVPGVRVVHELIGPADLICYLETADAREFRLRLDNGIGALKDLGYIDHSETLLILSDAGVGYSGEENVPAALSAWLLIDTTVGDQRPVLNQLIEIEGVRNAHAVVGRTDIVAYLEANSLEELRDILDKKIGAIEQIKFPDTRFVLMSV